MVQLSKKIVFFGTEDFSLHTLQALVSAGFDVAAVVTKPDSPQGRGHKLTPPKVKTYATEHAIPVWQPTKLAEITGDIQALGKPVGVLVSFGKIIPKSIIDLFDPGIINVHPSLLPKYRGPSPIESAMLHDDKETGVSIMQLSARMDAGPVYGYTPLALTGSETRAHLYETLGDLGSQTLIKLLPLIVNGQADGLPQDDQQASYCNLIAKSDSIIDWHKSARQIEREIRAYAGWPQSRTKLGDIDVIITKAHVQSGKAQPGQVATSGGALSIGTSQDLLVVDAIKPLGKKEMPVQAFLAGYASQLDSYAAGA